MEKDKPELKEVHSQVLQDVVLRVNLAFKAFFRRVQSGEEDPGYPRFKGKTDMIASVILKADSL